MVEIRRRVLEIGRRSSERTNHAWLGSTSDDCSVNDPSIGKLHAEANEIIAIFVSMVSRIRRKSSNRIQVPVRIRNSVQSELVSVSNFSFPCSPLRSHQSRRNKGINESAKKMGPP